MPICRTCKRRKAPAKFHKEKRHKNGRCSSCRTCESARRKRIRLANLPHARKRERAASLAAWDRQPHVRAYAFVKARAKRTGAVFTLTQQFLKELFAIGKCAFCDRKITPRAKNRPDRATLDKLIPADGYTPRNTVLACSECNRKKDNSSPAELRMLASGIERLLLEKKWQ